MANTDKYKKALENPNVQKMLNGIGHYESSNQYGKRYNATASGEQIDRASAKGYAGHPGLKRMADGKEHSAAGRFQIIDASWKRAAKALGLTDFNDPSQQDLAAVWLMDQRKSGGKSALQHAQDGDLVASAKLLPKEWAVIDKLGPENFVNKIKDRPVVPFGKESPQDLLSKAYAWKPDATAPKAAQTGTQTGTQTATSSITPVDKGNPYATAIERYNDPTASAPETGPNPFLDAIASVPRTGAGGVAGDASFQTAMDEYYANPPMDQRTVPGTPESLTVNPWRAFLARSGIWDLPEQSGVSPIFKEAADQGATWGEWMNSVGERFGLKPEKVESNSPYLSDMLQNNWGNALKQQTDAHQQEALDKVFGDGGGTADVQWPEGLDQTIEAKLGAA